MRPHLSLCIFFSLSSSVFPLLGRDETNNLAGFGARTQRLPVPARAPSLILKDRYDRAYELLHNA